MAQQASTPHPSSLFGGPSNSTSFSAIYPSTPQPQHHQIQGPAAMSSALSTTAGNNNNNPDPHFAALHASASSSVAGAGAGISTPASNASSANNTYIMPNSPVKNRNMVDGYRPKVTRTLGQRPACLVNASVTYCGNNQIYAFGGFDQYTDEVYNHVLKLDLVSHQWSLVDNYGDIPGVRMGMFCSPSSLLPTSSVC